ncbi:hypothetical protein D3C77_706020 [compost metagenome]
MSLRPKLIRLGFVVNIEGHGEKEDKSFNALLPVDPKADEGHAVVHHAHDQAADNGADDSADAARGGSATDEAGCDGVQLKVRACLWCS